MAHHRSGVTPWFPLLIASLLLVAGLLVWSRLGQRFSDVARPTLALQSIPREPLPKRLPPGLPLGPGAPSSPTR